jgi:hypothetical protein
MVKRSLERASILRSLKIAPIYSIIYSAESRRENLSGMSGMYFVILTYTKMVHDEPVVQRLADIARSILRTQDSAVSS